MLENTALLESLSTPAPTFATSSRSASSSRDAFTARNTTYPRKARDDKRRQACVSTIFLTALPAEAKPLRHALGLIRDNRFTALPLYRNAALALVITGAGPQAAKQAIATLIQQLPRDPQCHWINCGIAGHPDRPLGAAVAIDRLRSADEPDYTPLETTDMELPRLPLISHPQAEFSYAEPTCVDMEAAYLYRELSKQIPHPRFRCLKVISDNTQSQGAAINAKQVSAWMTALLPALEAMATKERRSFKDCHSWPPPRKST